MCADTGNGMLFCLCIDFFFLFLIGEFLFLLQFRCLFLLSRSGMLILLDLDIWQLIPLHTLGAVVTPQI